MEEKNTEENWRIFMTDADGEYTQARIWSCIEALEREGHHPYKIIHGLTVVLNMKAMDRMRCWDVLDFLAWQRDYAEDTRQRLVKAMRSVADKFREETDSSDEPS